MTIKQAHKEFNLIARIIYRDTKDKAACREQWSFYIDMLHRDGIITDKQVNNWIYPEWLN